MKNRKQETPCEADNLSEFDWNFDNVVEEELVACCYWEYARESAFIRDVKLRCADPMTMEMTIGQARDFVGNDIERIQSIGYPAEVFLPGFFFVESKVRKRADPDASPITGSFPSPWQSLSAAERKARSPVRSDRDVIPLVPFKRGRLHDAKDIVEWATARRMEKDALNDQVRRENPGVSEERLCHEGKLRFPETQPSLFWAGGAEVTVCAIEWAHFTNDEIANCFRRWLKAHRPRRLRAPSGKGHKPNDWRANLSRLAVMRLLGRFTALEIVDPRQNKFPRIWNTKQFARRKWGDVTKWHDARRAAGQLFGRLLPFLTAAEKPLLWNRHQPAK